MPQQISKKIIIYLSFLLMLVTTNNINLLTLDFFKISNLNIVGLKYEEKEKFKESLNFLKNKNLIFLDKDEILKKIFLNKTVEDLSIFKNYPSDLKIIIKKTKFLATTKKANQNYYIGSNGKLILAENLENNLPFVFGDVDVANFLKLKNSILKTEFDYDQVKNLYYFKSKRWDIETKDGLIIKLPLNNVEKALKTLSKILISKKFVNIKVVDLRQKNQVILND
tara:strand:+ start:2184 stop:2855 length:672 start_codon:yes stop_codon:yes gene_type:complete